MAEYPETNMQTWKPKGYYVHSDGVVYSTLGFPPDVIDGCKKLQFLAGDIVVASYPKSGTTWMQEILYLIQNGADLAEARQRPMRERVLFIEQAYPGNRPNLQVLNGERCPRLMFTHLRPRYYEGQIRKGSVKFVVVTRNPKDNLVSYYHFHRMNQAINFPGNWDDFFDFAKKGDVIYGDYFDWNTEWWKLKDLENICFVSYEQMTRNLKGVIQRVSKFVGKDLSDEEVSTIAHATSFNSMKTNPSTNQTQVAVFDQTKSAFLRKGQVGDWKNYFNDEQNQFIQEKVDTVFKPLGIEIEFESRDVEHY